MDNASHKMQKALEIFQANLGKIRSNRAHTGFLDNIQVDSYGEKIPLKQLALVNLGDAQSLLVQPFDINTLSAIEKAIRESNLGLNPSKIGYKICVPLPLLTTDRRKELLKLVKTETEHAKISIRNIRKDENNFLRQQLKDKTISEDAEKRAQSAVQTMTDTYIKNIDDLATAKEEDILKI